MGTPFRNFGSETTGIWRSLAVVFVSQKNQRIMKASLFPNNKNRLASSLAEVTVFLAIFVIMRCYDDVLYIWSLDQMYILGKDLLWKKVE